MYTLGVRRDFITRHYLVGGDWGPENFPNSHHYVLELRLNAAELDVHGYLVDIVEVSRHLDELISYFGEVMLNDLPEFRGLNPSLEHFARILTKELDRRIQAPNIIHIKVCLWENDHAWAAYELEKTPAEGAAAI
ncbi:MAG TPA: 6-carboxytetrahydropterin synthase [Anaerolineales bacterium]|nr:6-carboxytetrahydropterin synthase [Anaerolineales bacterium]